MASCEHCGGDHRPGRWVWRPTESDPVTTDGQQRWVFEPYNSPEPVEL